MRTRPTAGMSAKPQRQLALFTWIVASYPRWLRRLAHRRMLDRMFDRIIGEEAHE